LSKCIEIGGIKAIATRDPNTCTYLRWSIVEASTGCSLMPCSWKGGDSADTLEHATQLVRREVIEKIGKDKILERVEQILTERREVKSCSTG
jgi:hypothetical protein